ncbi:helix-turn-helix domain-containing protein [Sutcliffiella cohnii]|uniref:helix-turn-helix domain-containing protein n=1 Tax=Sutcliffiella cohnii TaxID=33932 RepID=UPI000833E219|nr:helix-turn-helix domain-containing protein [Sutcliffiella cohnii]
MDAKKTVLTTDELAKRLGVTDKTVYNYIKQGKVIPFNKDNWHWDGQYYFYEEDINIDSLIEKKPGLTTGEVAKKLGVSQTTALKFIKDGQLIAEPSNYKGRTMYFVKEEEVIKFKELYSNQKRYEKKVFYSKEFGYCLFQLFINKNTNEIARIKEINQKEITALTESGRVIKLQELLNEGFVSSYTIEEGKYNTKKGYAKFRFNKPRQIKATTYRILDLFYQAAGPLNIRLFEEEEMIEIEIKPTLIEIERDDYTDEIIMMEQSLIEGKVGNVHNGVLIDSDLEVLQVYLPSSLKTKVKKAAERESLTIDDLMANLIKKELE